MLSVQKPSGRGLLTHVRRDVPSTDQSHLPGTPVAIAVGDGSVWVSTTKGRTGALLRIDPRTRAVRTLALPGLDAIPNVDRRRSRSRLVRTDGHDGLRQRAALSPLPDRSSNDADHRQPPNHLLPDALRTGDRSGLCLGRREPRGGAVPTPARRPQDAAGDRCGPHAPLRPGHLFSSRALSFVALDGNTIWYAGDGAARVDTRTSRIVARIHLLDHPNLFAFPSAIVTGGGSVWIAIAAPT